MKICLANGNIQLGGEPLKPTICRPQSNSYRSTLSYYLANIKDHQQQLEIKLASTQANESNRQTLSSISKLALVIALTDLNFSDGQVLSKDRKKSAAFCFDRASSSCQCSLYMKRMAKVKKF